MHDVDHEFEGREIANFIYLHDNVELTTIGVDVGSSTYHLMFARVHLQRETQEHSSRFEVVEREVLWRSSIGLTPYAGKWIDTEAVREFVAHCHKEAGLSPDDVDSGAVILTGEALRQRNARALADAIAAGSGKFVCVSAGHHLEAMLAAFGSGAVQYSADHDLKLFHIDIGGGTTKLALIDRGTVRATAAVMIGGRQVAFDDGVVHSTSAGAATVAREAGISCSVGAPITAEERDRFVAAQVGVLIDLANDAHANLLERRLRLTRVLPRGFAADAVSFSGGVAEYIYGREERGYGDLGPAIGAAMRAAIDVGEITKPVVDPGEGIRATVAGASQCSVQLSGSTVRVTSPEILPMHNVPVVHPDLIGRLATRDFAADEVAAAITTAVADYNLTMDEPLALAFTWDGDPSFTRLNNFATGVERACGAAGDAPVIILMDQDIGASIGRILANEHDVTRPIICLDGLELAPLDFVDVGQVLEPSGALPVVIKSLLFGERQRES